MPEANDLTTRRAILDPAQNLILKNVTDSFYQELDADFANFKGHTLVSTFSWDEDWPTWEVHPHGDEMVILIEGDTDFVLSVNGTEEVIRVSRPGQYAVVPKNTWHTARPHKPTTMIFITPGEGTVNALEPGGEPVY